MAKPPPRLFIPEELEAGVNLPLEGARWHYLHTVLRLGPDNSLLVFNGKSGEWRARISAAEKRRGIISVMELNREQATVPDLTLYFAPLKKDPTELIIQKGTELGVRHFQPVITTRTILSKGGLKMDRLEAIAIEAAEQSERLDIPTVLEPVSLETVLPDENQETHLIFCDEAGDQSDERWGGDLGRAEPIADAFARQDGEAFRRTAILIGPEGGFSPEERKMLRIRSMTTPVSLGPRILKAETAAVSALTVWQALRGDWR